MGRFVFGREEEGDNSHLGGKARGTIYLQMRVRGTGRICIWERVGGRFASAREREWDDLYLGERGRGTFVHLRERGRGDDLDLGAHK